MAGYKEHTFLLAAARTTDANSSAQRCAGMTQCTIIVTASAVTGTNPTWDVKPQISQDGTNFADVMYPPDITEAIAVPQMTTTGTKSITFPLSAKFMRLAQAFGGTTPSFTGTAKAMFSKES